MTADVVEGSEPLVKAAYHEDVVQPCLHGDVVSRLRHVFEEPSELPSLAKDERLFLVKPVLRYVGINR